jgi:hypothetical protein
MPGLRHRALEFFLTRSVPPAAQDLLAGTPDSLLTEESVMVIITRLVPGLESGR